MTTEETKVLAFRATPDLVRQIDEWCKRQDGLIGRAEAIRRLLVIGLRQRVVSDFLTEKSAKTTSDLMNAHEGNIR